MKKNKIYKVSVFLLAALLMQGCSESSATYADLDLNSVSVSKDTGCSPSDDSSEVSLSCENVSEDVIIVGITGEIQNPGVYYLPKGSRVFELINAAGGFLETADSSGLNLVYELKDGMQLNIPSADTDSDNQSLIIDTLSSKNIVSGGVQNENPAKEGVRVNINTASESELTTLTGIGSTRALAIIEYREKNGKFNTIDDIKNVSGIKEGTFEKIRDKICTD